MTFTIYIDERRWAAHLKRVLSEFPALVPVCKGNGYGVGNVRLAAEASALEVDTVAVGTEREVPGVRGTFPGNVLVLAPINPAAISLPYDDDRHVIRTVAHPEHLEKLPARSRVVIECRTSMNRHGIRPTELATLPYRLRGVQLEGFALHLPLDRSQVEPTAEAAAWLEHLHDARLPTSKLWVSHLDADELQRLRAQFPATTFRPRIGTRLWLGDRDAITARGAVLDVEPLARGERSGYRQHPAPSRGHLVVVSGGTAHGVALEAPKAVRGLAPRAKVMALGTLEAAGRNLSPFTWAGKQRWFLEPPHMQVSMVFVPDRVAPPRLGDELECRVRLTTTHPDRVLTM